MLGPRPQSIGTAGSVRPQTYASIRAALDEFSNVLEETESEIPFDLVPDPSDDGGAPSSSPDTDSLGRSLYFCVQHNERMLRTGTPSRILLQDPQQPELPRVFREPCRCSIRRSIRRCWRAPPPRASTWPRWSPG